MRLAREGYPFAASGFLLAGTSWTAVSLGIGGTPVEISAWVLSAVAILVVWFFRDPEPTRPVGAELVVAPGQGRILQIEDVEEATFMGGAARKITIFLSVFDVHVQRAPVSGTVTHKEYKPGTYAVAWSRKASDDNEQSSLGIATENGPVLVRQIAGMIARRIITEPSEGDTVERSKRFGLIRFGSRVDLFLPKHWDVLCEVGDRVRVGTTVLAKQTPETA